MLQFIFAKLRIAMVLFLRNDYLFLFCFQGCPNRKRALTARHGARGGRKVASRSHMPGRPDGAGGSLRTPSEEEGVHFESRGRFQRGQKRT